MDIWVKQSSPKGDNPHRSYTLINLSNIESIVSDSHSGLYFIYFHKVLSTQDALRWVYGDMRVMLSDFEWLTQLIGVKTNDG